MRISRFTLLIPALFAALTGCVSTDVYDFQRDPTLRAAPDRYERLIVHCSAKDPLRRAVVEHAIVDELRDAGYDATAASEDLRSKSGVEFNLREVPGYDALVWIGFGSYERETSYQPGYVQHHVGFSGGYFGGHHGGYFGPTFGTTIVAPSEHTRYFLRTRIELIDAATEKKVWTAKADSRTSRNNSFEELAEDLGEEIVGILAHGRP